MGYKTREWRKSMRVTVDYNNMTEQFLGDKGFSERESASTVRASRISRRVSLKYPS